MRTSPPPCDLPTVERRFGITACRAEGTTVHTVMHTGPWMADANGNQQAGSLGVVLDHAMGEIMHAARPPGHWALTTELAFDIIVAPPWPTTTLHASAWAPTGDATTGFAQAQICDDDGRPIAVATTRTQYVVAGAAGVPAPPPEAPGEDWDRAPTFADHVGARVTVDDERIRVELLNPDRWRNTYGVLHGGIWAGIAEIAAAETFARNGVLRTAHVHVTYLRALPTSTAVSVFARKVHIGRSLGMVEIIGSAASGQRCVVATVTGRGPES